MKSLLIRSITRLASEISLPLDKKLTIEEVEKVIQKEYGGSIKWKDLVRVPDTELRTMLKVPCPVGNFKGGDI